VGWAIGRIRGPRNVVRRKDGSIRLIDLLPSLIDLITGSLALRGLFSRNTLKPGAKHLRYVDDGNARVLQQIPPFSPHLKDARRARRNPHALSLSALVTPRSGASPGYFLALHRPRLRRRDPNLCTLTSSRNQPARLSRRSRMQSSVPRRIMVASPNLWS